MSVLWHANPLAMYLNILLPFAAVLAFKPRARSDRWLGGVTLVLGFVALFFTVSRGGWLAAMAWIPLLVAVLALTDSPSSSLRRSVNFLLARKRWLTAIGISTLAIGLTGLAVALATRPDWLFRATVNDRFEALAVGIGIAKDRWLIGAGPGSYLSFFDEYKLHPEEIYGHAHNLYVTLLSEVGLFGCVVIILGGYALFRSLFLALRTPGVHKPYVAAAIAGLTATLVHGLADLPIYAPNVLLVPLALLLGLSLREVPCTASPLQLRLQRFDYLPRLAVVALIPLVVGLWLYSDSQQIDYENSLANPEMIELINDGVLDYDSRFYTSDAVSALQDVAESASQVANADSGLWPYQLHAGVSFLQLYAAEEARGEREPALLDQGMRYLTRANEIDPKNSLILTNLALGKRFQGEREAAVDTTRQSIEYAPLNPEVYAAAASTFEWAGLHQEAVEAYGKAIELHPSLTQSPFWITQPESLRAEAIVASGLESCILARHAALYGTYKDDLQALADQCRVEYEQDRSSLQRADLVIALAALDERAEAKSLLDETPASELATPDFRIANAFAIGVEDMGTARGDLFAAGLLDSFDARAELLGTYIADRAAEYGIHPTLTDPTSNLPGELHGTAKGAALEPESRHYFRLGAFRPAPLIIIVRGEWSNLTPPERLLSRLAIQTLLDEGKAADEAKAADQAKAADEAP